MCTYVILRPFKLFYLLPLVSPLCFFLILIEDKSQNKLEALYCYNNNELFS